MKKMQTVKCGALCCYAVSLLLLSMIAFSCKKAELATPDANAADMAGVTTKISNWLNYKKAGSGTLNAGKIASLQNNLDYAAAYTEPFRDGERFVIVPIKDGFVTTVHTKQNPAIYLFAILDAKGEVRKTNIVQYIAADGKKATSLPKNTFTDLFVDKTAKVDGDFFFLNLLDRITWGIGFRNGKQSSVSVKVEKQATASKMECKAWFLVTTYSDGEGNSFETEEYLYTTCENVQSQSELDPTPCENCTGGSGEDYNDQNDPPTTMTSDQTWTLEDRVTVIGGVNVSWKVTSTERLTGSKYQLRSARFTSIAHQSSQLVAPTNTGTWFQGTVDANLVAPSNGWSFAADSKVDGDVVFSDRKVLPYPSRNKRCTWVAFQLWP